MRKTYGSSSRKGSAFRLNLVLRTRFAISATNKLIKSHCKQIAESAMYKIVKLGGIFRSFHPVGNKTSPTTTCKAPSFTQFGATHPNALGALGATHLVGENAEILGFPAAGAAISASHLLDYLHDKVRVAPFGGQIGATHLKWGAGAQKFAPRTKKSHQISTYHSCGEKSGLEAI